MPRIEKKLDKIFEMELYQNMISEIGFWIMRKWEKALPLQKKRLLS